MEKPTYSELEQKVAALEAQVGRTGVKPRRHVWRRVGIGALVALGCIGVAVADLGLWANRNVVSQQGYVNAVAPLASDSSVQAALVKAASDKINSSVDIQAAVTQVLPERAAFLAAPITTQVKNGIQQALASAAASDKFAQVWATLNERAHQRLVNVIQKYEGNGQITLNDAYAYLGQQLQGTPVGSIVNKPLPAQFGSIQLVDAQWLPVAHDAWVALSWAVPVASLLALVTFGGAIWASRHRRKTIIAVSLSTAFTLALVNIAVRLVQQVRQGQIHDATYRAAAKAVNQAIVGPLFVQTRVWIVVALVVAVIAWATGPFRAAERMRVWLRGASSSIMRSTGNWGAGTPAVRWLFRRRRVVEWCLVAVAVVALMFMTPLTIAIVVWTAAVLVVLILLVEIITSTTRVEESGTVQT